MTHYLNHLNLTKGKISKLYKKKKQTLKKKHGKRIKRGGRSYRKKRHLNLANKTVKNMQNGGGMFDWFTGPSNKQGEKQPLNTNNPSSSSPSQGLFSRFPGYKSPVMNEYQTPVINPILQPSNIQQSNEKQEKMNQVIQELREKLKRENKLQDSQPSEIMDDDNVSNIPFEEELTNQSVMNPIHENQPSTEYGEENQDTNGSSLMNPMHFKESKANSPPENQVLPPQADEEEENLTASMEYGEKIPETPEEVPVPQGNAIEYHPVTPEEIPVPPTDSCEYLNEIKIPESHCLDTKEYRSLALKLHPDKNPKCLTEATKKFQELDDKKCKNEDEDDEVTQEEEQEHEEEFMPAPQEYHEVTPEEVPVPQQQEEEVPVPKEENLTSSTEYGEILPETPEENLALAPAVAPALAPSVSPALAPALSPALAPAPSVNPVDSFFKDEETKAPTESTDFYSTGSSSTFDQEDEEISRMPSAVSNSFQNIIDYMTNQIVDKISNVLGYSSGSNEEKLQNGFTANNLNNRTIGVGGRKSLRHPPPEGKGDGLPLRPPLCRTRRSYKKAKKYTRRV